MLVRVGGGKGGFKFYLENGMKAGRDFHRNELDQRVPLLGDLDVFELATSLHEGDGRIYDHITLAFDENNVTDELLQIAVNEFREHALAAWPEEDRHRVPMYAEAHRPRLQSYTNSETCQDVERFIHIHIGIGRHDLLTGKAVELLGYLGPKTENIKYIDAFQEYFNSKYGFSSPKDNPRITPENAIDVIARYSGKTPDEFGSQNAKKAALEITLQKEIIEKNVTTWSDFEKLLSGHGTVSKINEGRSDECYRIKQTDSAKAMRLKSVFFQRQFIERPTTEKIAIIQQKAKSSYLEKMQPRKEPQYVAGVLAEWNKTKAKEFRYLNTGSAFYKKVYLPADATTRFQILNDLERKNHGITSPPAVKNRQITPTRNRVPGMRIRDMDGIQRRSEMLLPSHSDMDVPDEYEGGKLGVELRQADGRTGVETGQGNTTTTGTAVEGGVGLLRGIGRSERTINARRYAHEEKNDKPEGSSESKWRSSVEKVSSDGPHVGWRSVHLYKEGWDERREDRVVSNIIQPSSVLGRFQAELLERYEFAADKEKYAEIRQNIDCAQLIASLSHSHGLNPDLYKLTTGKDGSPRIQCGSRALTASDFLTKEIGLDWKVAAPILRKVYEHQVGKITVGPRISNGVPRELWKEFALTQKANRANVKAFKDETKSIVERAKTSNKSALAKLSGPHKKTERLLGKSRLAQLKVERQTLLEAIQPPPQEQALRLFLQTRAQAGDAKALTALRGLDSTPRTAPAQGITGIIYFGESDEEKSKRRRNRARAASIFNVYAVTGNGDVTYHQNGRAVIRDEGQHIAVLDQNNDEAIAAALLLAREKFGTDLTLNGSAEFQHRVVAVAVAQGMQIKFVDPNLEAMRLQLVSEKRQARISEIAAEAVAQAPVISPTQLEPDRAADAPRPQHQLADDQAAERAAAALAALAEAHRVDQEEKAAANYLGDIHQQTTTAAEKARQQAADQAAEPAAVDLMTGPLAPTAEQWIAANALHQVDAYERAPKTEFVVKYLAADAIVIDHGRSVAIYPKPEGGDLHAGDRVKIVEGALSRAADRGNGVER